MAGATHLPSQRLLYHPPTPDNTHTRYTPLNTHTHTPMRKNTKKHTIFKKYHHNLLWPSLVISVILMRGYHTPLSHTLTHSLILSSCTMNVSIKVDVSTAEEVSVTVDIILTHQTVHVSWPQERHKVDIGDRSDGHGWVSWWSLMTLHGHWWSWSSVRSHGHRVYVILMDDGQWEESHLWQSWSWVRRP